MTRVVQGGLVPPDEPAHKPSGLAEFIRGPWFPLVVTLPVVILIILAELLKALAAVIVALTGLITAAGRYHRR
jgi:hypothetical protein